MAPRRRPRGPSYALMMLPAALLLLGALTAVVAPRLPARADWADREPVPALWVWLGGPGGAWWRPCC
ncbi:hypothetical protein QFZ76_001519 [Streptomyces sp. V4I2]|nr:hypothetical protein [Streptomyces sp. V4I2]